MIRGKVLAVKFLVLRLAFALLTPCLVAQTASITTSVGQTTITNTEPGIYSVDGLFRSADIVAVVKILSGDTEHYEFAVYKAEVVQGFKGTAQGDTLYFGPYVGLRLGWEYVVFLQTAREMLQPTAEKTLSYGPVPYQKIFNEGYTALLTSYECVFDGEAISQRCDDTVRVCTDYVKLPNTITLAPQPNKDAPFGCRWTRRKQFIALLEKLAATKQ